MAVVAYNHFGIWDEDIETAESAEPCYCNGCEEPVTSSLFASCMRYFALKGEEISGLPKSMVQRIESLKYDMEIVGKIHQEYITFKLSWIGLGKDGNVDWLKTYAKCYREMPPDDFFIFAAINGIATRALWKRMDDLEKQHMLDAYDDVIRNTALLMYYPSVFNVIQYRSIVVAAQHGWPGAVCAWIGLRNNTLNNIDYEEELVANFKTPLYQTFSSPPSNYLENAILLAIHNEQYHLLRYLPTVDLTDSFNLLFPDGHVSLNFFQQLIDFPVIESLFNDKLSDYLKSVVRALLIWMSLSEVQRLQRMLAGAGDIKIRNCINQILNDINIITRNTRMYAGLRPINLIDACDAVTATLDIPTH
ncbi:hypothetical protein LOAG_16687 [Loa loa]|uniref:Uncharacterized protein n=1 Tax=Loa loa TaxID=7209 RepID=A0A1S0UL82_LOALO|nr:hypothetical protein LOAG_16687 [Loa loa]EJD76339.1 hypothetical protein LOAG_16687 [Loa loa]